MGFQASNNARAEILGGLGSGATTLTVKSGQGALFPSTGDFILTLEKYDADVVTAREVVKATGRSGDVITIVRAVEPCPESDTASTQTQVARSFDDGDFVELTASAGTFQDAFDELDRLEDEKLDNDELREGLATNRVVYIDNSGNEQLLPLGTATQVLTSNGTTDAPTFESPSVDIVALSEDTDGDLEADEFVKNDGSGNEKIKMSRYRASDEDILAGTNNKKFATAKQVDYVIAPAVGPTIFNQGGELFNTESTLTKEKTINIAKGGTYNVQFNYATQSINPSGTARFRIHVNGSPVGSEVTRSAGSGSTDYQIANQSITVEAGDELQLYIQGTAPGGKNSIFAIQGVPIPKLLIDETTGSTP